MQLAPYGFFSVETLGKPRMPTRPSSHHWRHNYFFYLLLSLLGMLFTLPYVHHYPVGGYVYHGLMTLILVLSLYALDMHRISYWFGLALGLPAVAANWAMEAWDAPFAAQLSHGSNMLFLSYISGMMIYAMLKEQRITRNTLFAGACCFLLMGFAWTSFYALATSLEPGAFRLAEAGRRPEYVDFLYYSLITLTTTGYGDITPALAPVRLAAAFEAVVGQFYMAILVARLVGLHISQRGELTGG